MCIECFYDINNCCKCACDFCMRCGEIHCDPKKLAEFYKAHAKVCSLEKECVYEEVCKTCIGKSDEK